MPSNPIINFFRDLSRRNTSYGVYNNSGIHVSGQAAQITLVYPQVGSAQPQTKERKLCPHPVASFTGRKEILDKMHRYFRSESDFQRVFVLHGLGGSGKSQIAFKFVQEFTGYDSTLNETMTSDNLFFQFQFLRHLLC
jgi:hypothetical protein